MYVAIPLSCCIFVFRMHSGLHKASIVGKYSSDMVSRGAVAFDSTRRQMFVISHSEPDSTVVTCSGTCECNPSSGTASGTISDGPSNYTDNMDCIWLIASEHEISLSFTSFSTELDDFVSIYRCSTSSCSPESREEVGRLSGGASGSDDAIFSTVYTSSTGYLQVVFTSDGSGNYVQSSGFVANWKVKPRHALLVLTLPGGEVLRRLDLQVAAGSIWNVHFDEVSGALVAVSHGLNAELAAFLISIDTVTGAVTTLTQLSSPVVFAISAFDRFSRSYFFMDSSTMRPRKYSLLSGQLSAPLNLVGSNLGRIAIALEFETNSGLLFGKPFRKSLPYCCHVRSQLSLCYLLFQKCSALCTDWPPTGTNPLFLGICFSRVSSFFYSSGASYPLKEHVIAS